MKIFSQIVFGIILSTSQLLAINFTSNTYAQNLITQNNSVNSIYKNNQKELSPKWLLLYTIVEKISRANNLDEYPWRIEISPTYAYHDIGAYASEINLITITEGFLDQIYPDASAIACLFGHEIAHHHAHHNSNQTQFAFQKQEELTRKVNVEHRREMIAREILKRSGADTFISNFSNKIENNIPVDLPPINKFKLPIPIIGAIFGKSQSIQEKKENAFFELQKNRIEQIKRDELFADKLGFEFAVKAGFEPEGCERLMNVLARISKISPHHPDTDRRTSQIKQLIQPNKIKVLKDEGFKNMSQKKPLTHEYGTDGNREWLKINSKYHSPEQ